MKRRTFIAGVGTTTTLFLAGCNSSGKDTKSSSETSSGETTTDSSGTTTGTDSATSTNSASTTKNGTDETTNETTTASETTTSDETTTDSSGTTTTKTVSFGEHVTIADGLSVGITGADASDSYKHGGTTEKASSGSTYLLVTFEAKNSGESSRSLPDDASLTVRVDDKAYSMTDSAMSAWKGYRSSGVKAGDSASTTVAFEVPKKAVDSLGVTVSLSYTDSGSKQEVRWSME